MNDVKFLQGVYSGLSGKTDLAQNAFYVATDKAVMAVGGQKYYGQPTIKYEGNQIKLLGVSGETENPVVLGAVDLTLDSFLEGAVYVSDKEATKVVINGKEVQFENDDRAKLPGIVMLMHNENSTGDTHSVVIVPASDFAGAVQSEIDKIETAVGLGADGTHVQATNGNYTSGASTIAGEIAALDTQLKATADKADTALQGVSATGDSFVSAEFANGTNALYRELTVSTTIKEVSAATTSADGLAKASDVKAYVDSEVSKKNVDAEGDTYVSAIAANNKVTVSASESTKASLGKADTALQTVTASGDEYVSATFADKANGVTTQALTVSTKIHEIASASADTDGLATAFAVKQAVANAQITDVKYVSGTKKINLYNGNKIVGEGIDASDFIKDGMLDSASLVTELPEGTTGHDNENGPWIALTWNTDAGKTDMFVSVASLVDTYTVKEGSKDYLAISGYEVEAKTLALASVIEDEEGETPKGLAEASDVKSYVDAQASASKTVVTGPDTGHVTVSSNVDADDNHVTYTITANDIQSATAYTEDKKNFLTGGTVNSVSATPIPSDSGATFTVEIEGSNIALASSYTAPVYVAHFSAATANTISATDKVDVAVNKLDNKVAALVDEVVANEATVASAIENLATAAGTKGATDGVIAYQKSENDIISGATSLSEADELLASAIQNIQATLYWGTF